MCMWSHVATHALAEAYVPHAVSDDKVDKDHAGVVFVHYRCLEAEQAGGFINKKFFHPSSIRNQERLWKAMHRFSIDFV